MKKYSKKESQIQLTLEKTIEPYKKNDKIKSHFIQGDGKIWIGSTSGKEVIKESQWGNLGEELIENLSKIGVSSHLGEYGKNFVFVCLHPLKETFSTPEKKLIKNEAKVFEFQKRPSSQYIPTEKDITRVASMILRSNSQTKLSPEEWRIRWAENQAKMIDSYSKCMSRANALDEFNFHDEANILRAAAMKAVNEGSYDDFEKSYSTDISNALSQLSEISDLYDVGLDEEVYDQLDEIGSKYDKNVMGFIENWRSGMGRRDLVDIAIKNQDRYGTEPRQILNAIDDVYRCFVNNDLISEEEEEIMEKISVETYGGKIKVYTKNQIKGFLKDLNKSLGSDDLPKWIFSSSSLGMGQKKKVESILKKVLDHEGEVRINVRSDKTDKNKIEFVKESKKDEINISYKLVESKNSISKKTIEQTVKILQDSLKNTEDAEVKKDLPAAIKKLQKTLDSLKESKGSPDADIRKTIKILQDMIDTGNPEPARKRGLLNSIKTLKKELSEKTNESKKKSKFVSSNHSEAFSSSNSKIKDEEVLKIIRSKIGWNKEFTATDIIKNSGAGNNYYFQSTDVNKINEILQEMKKKGFAKQISKSENSKTISYWKVSKPERESKTNESSETGEGWGNDLIEDLKRSKLIRVEYEKDDKFPYSIKNKKGHELFLKIDSKNKKVHGLVQGFDDDIQLGQMPDSVQGIIKVLNSLNKKWFKENDPSGKY